MPEQRVPLGDDVFFDDAASSAREARSCVGRVRVTFPEGHTSSVRLHARHGLLFFEVNPSWTKNEGTFHVEESSGPPQEVIGAGEAVGRSSLRDQRLIPC